MVDDFSAEELRKLIDDLPAKVEIPKNMDKRNEWWIIYSPAIVNTLLRKLAAALKAKEEAEAKLKDHLEGVGNLCLVHNSEACPECVADLRRAESRVRSLEADLKAERERAEAAAAQTAEYGKRWDLTKAANERLAGALRDAIGVMANECVLTEAASNTLAECKAALQDAPAPPSEPSAPQPEVNP